MKPRQEVICWQCNEQFSIRLPEKTPANLTAYCPYCGAECLIQFREVDELKALFRDGNEEVTLTGRYKLPEIMDTHKPD